MLKEGLQHNVRNKVELSCYKLYHLAVFQYALYMDIIAFVMLFLKYLTYPTTNKSNAQFPLWAMQEIMIVIFNGASPRLGIVE